jgi:hypothetical protein
MASLAYQARCDDGDEFADRDGKTESAPRVSNENEPISEIMS